MEKITVYKGTDRNLCCRGYQYEIGKTEISDDAIRCGNKGFHACESPLDVLRYYGNRNGNRFFEAEASGKIDRDNGSDSKIAASELTLKAEIGIAGLIRAHIQYTRKKAENRKTGGDNSNLAGGNWSNLAGGDGSNLAGGNWSNLAGGNWSNLAGGGGSNLAGGDGSNLAGGYNSNLAGGNWSNLAGGNWSNLAGGNSSLIVGRNESRAKGGLHSVIVLTQWGYNEENVEIPVSVKAEIVDGERIKADTWYALKNGEFVEVE